MARGFGTVTKLHRHQARCALVVPPRLPATDSTAATPAAAARGTARAADRARRSFLDWLFNLIKGG